MKRLLEKSGHRKAFDIIKRTGSVDSEDMEGLKILSEIKRLTKLTKAKFLLGKVRGLSCEINSQS